MIDAVHKCHSGIENTINLAKNNIFWPGMQRQIEDKVRSCATCSKFDSSQQKLPMKSHDIPVYPWQFVSMDMCFPKYRGKVLNCLVIVDHYSDFIEIDILDDLSTVSTIRSMKRQFARYGVPEEVKTDEGTHFISSKMVDFAAKYGFRHSTSSAYHQQGNGKAEAAVKIAKRIIEKAIPAISSNFLPKIVEGVSEQISSQRQKAKFYYDRFTKYKPSLDVGQEVMVQIRPDRNIHWTPGIIQKHVTDRSYIVEVNNTPYRRDRVHIKPVLLTNDNNMASESASNPNHQHQEVNDTNEEYCDDAESFSTPIAEDLSTNHVVTENQPNRRPQRQRIIPRRLADYDLN